MLTTIQKQYQSSLTIGNAAAIVTGVIRQIAGNDISNSLNGSRVTTEIIESIVAQRLSQTLSI
jgi:hypothetical protein